MTKKKPNKKRPGPKVSTPDRLRVRLAHDLKVKNQLSDWLAIKRACLIYPAKLPSGLGQKLKGVGPHARLPQHLNADDQELFKVEITRMLRLLSNYEAGDYAGDGRWNFEMPNLPGSAYFTKEDTEPEPDIEQ